MEGLSELVREGSEGIVLGGKMGGGGTMAARCVGQKGKGWLGGWVAGSARVGLLEGLLCTRRGVMSGR